MKRSLFIFAVMSFTIIGVFLFLGGLATSPAGAMAETGTAPAVTQARHAPIPAVSYTPVSSHTFARAHQHHDFVDGQFEANATVAITVTDSADTVKGTGSGTAGGNGWMDGVYAGADIIPGDKIYVASSGGFSATLEMITIDAHVDLAADLVTGTMSGGTFPAMGNVEVNNPITGTGMPITITAGGHFAADFNGMFDIVEGDSVWAWYVDGNGNEVGGSAFYPVLDIGVNYAHEWVEGQTGPGAMVAVTLTDGIGAVKATAQVTAEGDGHFFVECSDWDTAPECPDIAPGDGVVVMADGLMATVDPIGTIDGSLDAAANTVSGTVSAPFTGTLDLRCEVWVENGPPGIDTTVDPGGGAYLCDFDDVGWDLEEGQDVAVIYMEPDGDRVINVFGWPWMRVNYAHDWVGGDYPAGHTIHITVTDSADTVIATAVITSQPVGGWMGDGFETSPSDWTPTIPTIEPGNKVAFVADDGYTNLVEVGTIDGFVSINADTVSGTVEAPWFTDPLGVDCHPWGAWEYGEDADVKSSMAEPDGSSEYLCDWSGAWDIVPGRDVAVMYVEPDGDRVINVVQGYGVYMPIIMKP